jgi:alpha-tubulin suppressor-like RCC1 family protein
MRSLIGCSLLALVAGGCETVRPCRPDTVYITVELGDAQAADGLLVGWAVGDGAAKSERITRRGGEPRETVELHFSKYPAAGEKLVVTVVAQKGATVLAQGSIETQVHSGCSSLHIKLEHGGPIEHDGGTDDVDMSGGGGDGGQGGQGDMSGQGGQGDMGGQGGQGDMGGKQLGDRCTPADSCASGQCVDGYCCNSTCTDSCGACDVPGKEGTCSPVATPRGGRTECPGTGLTCGAFCNGQQLSCADSTASCSVTASCSNGAETHAGNGTCGGGVCAPASQPAPCADKLCGATECQTVAQVAVGSGFACARLSDSTVRCWGAAGQKTPTPKAGLGTVKDLSVSSRHACAVLSDGSLSCWGANDYGQLGIGKKDSDGHDAPSPVCSSLSPTDGSCVPVTGIAKVYAGFLNTCALKTDGTVLCWGMNTYGQIGDGTRDNDRFLATSVCAPSGCPSKLSSITSLADVGYTYCALDTAKNVYCWGYGGQGQAGGKETFNLLPLAVSGITVGNQKPIQIAGANDSACAVLSDGTTAKNVVRCWGSNADGQRGNATIGDTIGTVAPPSTVCDTGGCPGSLAGVTHVSVGYKHVCAVGTGGAVYCWGTNDHGQLAIGTKGSDNALIPKATLLTAGAVELATPDYSQSTHCARILNGGTLRCWGSNSGGLIGDGGNSDALQPTPQKW